MDRTELFTKPDLSLVPLSRPRRNAISRPRPAEQYIYVGGDVVAVNDRLTRMGWRRVVLDLWGRVCVEVSRLRDPVDALTYDVDVLKDMILCVLPANVEVGRMAWPMLVEVARLMVVWCVEAGCEEELGEREVDGLVECVWGGSSGG